MILGITGGVGAGKSSVLAILEKEYNAKLILADEVALAGGRSYYNGKYSPNSNYYLYNGKYYWTLSPSYFDSYYSLANVWIVVLSGGLDPGYSVTNSFGVRPVINLRADTLMTKGDGTSLNPYSIG